MKDLKGGMSEISQSASSVNLSKEMFSEKV